MYVGDHCKNITIIIKDDNNENDDKILNNNINKDKLVGYMIDK